MAADPHRHPAWYGSVMGTGALALALAAQGSTWSIAWLAPVAFAVLLVASALAVILLPRYAGRLGTRDHLMAEIADPAHGPMLATLPAGLLILSVGWGRLAPTYVSEAVALWIAGILLVVGAVIALVLGLTWSTAVLRGGSGLQGVNGGWLIPPVMNLIVPLGIAPFITAFPDQAMLLEVVGFAFLGMGAVLFMAVLTLFIARLAMHEPLPAPMAPSMWIPLAPAGVLGLGFLRLQQAGIAAQLPGFESATTGLIVSAAGIGFGLWWAGFAALELRRIAKAGGPPRHPGWWGFVFPVAAMTLSITAVGAATAVAAINVIGALATIVLILVWLRVALATVPMLRRSTK